MIIRKINELDAEKFLNLCKALDQESKFMMLEPNERLTSVEEQKQYIKDLNNQNKSVILVCEIEHQLVGYVSGTRENFRRIAHSAYIVTGVRTEFAGKGLGTQLFTELEKWANLNSIHRLELTVMCHNHAAISLYKKMGYCIEGTKKHSLKIEGNYIDEYYMVKLL